MVTLLIISIIGCTNEDSSMDDSIKSNKPQVFSNVDVNYPIVYTSNDYKLSMKVDYFLNTEE